MYSGVMDVDSRGGVPVHTGDTYVPPPSRQEITSSCPGLEASPLVVRDWLATYLLYRGVDAAGADNFFWRGVELHRASYSTLFDALKHHCSLLEWEADILAYDIYTIVEDSIPPPAKTLLQRYIENVFGYEFYGNLMQWSKPNPGYLAQANCVFCWFGFLLTHAAFCIFILVIAGFLLSTR
ncbi:hypothetical protein F5Y15DRAFT_382328 [Xylariaceae sp. FL0016]|nr:hypothetical protein F5Y15DRAFT_382328 [Xylariaceae sp. FL0016]